MKPFANLKSLMDRLQQMFDALVQQHHYQWAVFEAATPWELRKADYELPAVWRRRHRTPRMAPRGHQA